MLSTYAFHIQIVQRLRLNYNRTPQNWHVASGVPVAVIRWTLEAAPWCNMLSPHECSGHHPVHLLRRVDAVPTRMCWRIHAGVGQVQVWAIESPSTPTSDLSIEIVFTPISATCSQSVWNTWTAGSVNTVNIIQVIWSIWTWTTLLTSKMLLKIYHESGARDKQRDFHRWF